MKKKGAILKTLIIILTTAIMFNSCKKPPPDAPVIITEISGKVLAKKTGDALPGAQITTLPVTSSVVTGSDGSYTLKDIAAGSYTITAQKDGYNTNTTNVTVAEGQTVSADILLDSQSPELNVNPLTLDYGTGQTNLTFNITNLVLPLMLWVKIKTAMKKENSTSKILKSSVSSPHGFHFLYFPI